MMNPQASCDLCKAPLSSGEVLDGDAIAEHRGRCGECYDELGSLVTIEETNSPIGKTCPLPA